MNTYREPRFYVIATGIFLFVFLLLGYALFQARHIIIGPSITIETPHEWSIVTEELINIRGNAQNITSITLNDRAIFIDEEGQFSEKLLLANGYTIMIIKAEDRFGRETQKTLHIVLN